MKEGNFRECDFKRVPIEEFVSGTELPVDLFINLSEVKYVQIAKAGDRVHIERLVNYKSKKVTHLLIRTEDYERYLQKGLAIAGVVLKSHEIPLAQRQTVLTQVAANVFQELESKAFDRKALQHAKSVAGAAIALCQGKSDLFTLMNQFASLSSNKLYAHSVAVSAVSVMIALKLNWKQNSTVEKLALGGLLHDIGKKELSVEILTKRRALMTKEELTEYESHSFRGMQILRSIPELPDDVVSIAYEHHENGLGFGFPRHLKQLFINPLARIVGLANEFCNLTMQNVDHSSGQPRSPSDAILYIKNVMGQPYWPEGFKALTLLVLGRNESELARGSDDSGSGQKDAA